MCKANCSGGCPECAPDEHSPNCVERYSKVDHCSCDCFGSTGMACTEDVFRSCSDDERCCLNATITITKEN